jgi:hypothetical protein
MHDEPIPEFIRAAGDWAVTEYRDFFDARTLSPYTRSQYRWHIRRFCQWAERRALTLKSITADDVAIYAAETTASYRTAKPQLWTIRKLLGHLGVDVARDKSQGRAQDKAAKPPIPPSQDSQAPLLIQRYQELMLKKSYHERRRRYHAAEIFKVEKRIRSVEQLLEWSRKREAGDGTSGPVHSAVPNQNAETAKPPDEV